MKNQYENQSVSVLERDIKYIRESIADIKSNIMPRTEIELKITEMQADLATIRTQIVHLEQKTNARHRWEVIGSNILTAFLTGAFVGMVMYILSSNR